MVGDLAFRVPSARAIGRIFAHCPAGCAFRRVGAGGWVETLWDILRERDTSGPFAAASRVECSVEPMETSVGCAYKSNARI